MSEFGGLWNHEGGGGGGGRGHQLWETVFPKAPCFAIRTVITINNPQWEGTQHKPPIVPFASKKMNHALTFKDNDCLDLLSALFNTSRVALEATQNKVDRNESGKSIRKYDNAIKIAHSSTVKIVYPFPIMKSVFCF